MAYLGAWIDINVSVQAFLVSGVSMKAPSSVPPAPYAYHQNEHKGKLHA